MSSFIVVLFLFLQSWHEQSLTFKQACGERMWELHACSVCVKQAIGCALMFAFVVGGCAPQSVYLSGGCHMLEIVMHVFFAGGYAPKDVVAGGCAPHHN